MYKESIEGKFNYTLQDTFMGFHCGNTASSKLSFCEMKYQMIMARSLPIEVTNGTLEGDIKLEISPSIVCRVQRTTSFVHISHTARFFRLQHVPSVLSVYLQFRRWDVSTVTC